MSKQKNGCPGCGVSDGERHLRGCREIGSGPLGQNSAESFQAEDSRNMAAFEVAQDANTPPGTEPLSEFTPRIVREYQEAMERRAKACGDVLGTIDSLQPDTDPQYWLTEYDLTGRYAQFDDSCMLLAGAGLIIMLTDKAKAERLIPTFEVQAVMPKGFDNCSELVRLAAEKAFFLLLDLKGQQDRACRALCMKGCNHIVKYVRQSPVMLIGNHEPVVYEDYCLIGLKEPTP